MPNEKYITDCKDPSSISIEEYELAVIQWADNRNILSESNSIAQLSKTLEECGELLAALNESYNNNSDRVARDIKDAYGDILVTLIVGMNIEGLFIQDCLAAAFNEIKDRRGTMINGVFVKNV